MDVKRLAQNFICKKPDRETSLAKLKSTIVPVHDMKAYSGVKVSSTYY
jgi:hypothetical protein